MVLELAGLPLEVLQESILVTFCSPWDLAQVLSASRGLRCLREGCVTSLLEKLFGGRPGAVNAIPWLRSHHGDEAKGKSLNDVSLVDWLHGMRDVTATGTYRAALGEAHTFVVTPGGRALAAGSGRYGVLGASGNMNHFLFTEVDLKWGQFPGRVPVAAVACGNHHTLILSMVGTVHSCGLGDYGRLGHGNEHDLSRPTLIPSLVGERITQVAAGQAHSVALSRSGDVYTWGWGFGYVLGFFDEKARLEPTRLVIPADTPSDDEGGGGGGGGTGGGDGSKRPGGGRVDWPTCITAGAGCTVIGTSSGRVLWCGPIVVHGEAYPWPGVQPFGRLSVALPCWHVRCIRLDWPRAADTPLVIDSTGQVHHVVFSPVPAYVDPQEGFTIRMPAPDGGRSSGVEDCSSSTVFASGGGTDGANGSGFTCGCDCATGAFARSGKTVWGHRSGCGVAAADSRRDNSGAGRQRTAPPPPPANCTSVLVSPAVKGVRGCWMESGHEAWGDGLSFLAVTADGCLLSSAGVGEEDELSSSGGAWSEGVLHASAWVGDESTASHGLMLVDGGSSVVTWGNARAGHLGHGGPRYEPTHKTVTTAVILGRMSEMEGKGGDRSAGVQVSIADSSMRRGAGTPGMSGGGGAAAASGAGSEGLLALVDAAADERDVADDRALADNEEEGRAEKRVRVGGKGTSSR